MRDVEVRSGKMRTCMSMGNEIIACGRCSIGVELDGSEERVMAALSCIGEGKGVRKV